MDKIMNMSEALLSFVAQYAEDNGLNNSEVLSSMAHTYVIYGFAVKLDKNSLQSMRDDLVKCVTASADHMLEVSSEQEA